MSNLDLYEKVRAVPKEAQKEIKAGRLKGMTDINPQWRIKTLTEHFGVCGFGWYPEIVRTWIETGANGEMTANVEIKLYVKQGGEWSKGITGIGGSKLVSKEGAGLYTSDECFKMAYTDAISVSCKQLGFGADIYYSADRTKYNNTNGNTTTQQTEHQEPVNYTETPKKSNTAHYSGLQCVQCDADVSDKVAKYSTDKFGKVLCFDCQKQAPKAETQTKIVPVEVPEGMPF